MNKMRKYLLKRLVLVNLLLIVTCFGLLFTTLWLLSNTTGLVIGLALAFIWFLFVMCYCCPRWFKDYIKYYWKKKEDESKDLQDDLVPN